MEREKQLQEINRQLSNFCSQIKLENAVNINSANIISENLIGELLNCILGCHFESAERKKHNQKGYDLIEYEKRIIIQISSENRADKVQRSLDKLEAVDSENWTFCFFLLGEKADNLRKKTYRVPEQFTFSPEKNIWDFSWLIREIYNLDSDGIGQVYYILQESSGKKPLTKKDVWYAVCKDYQMSRKDGAYSFGEEIVWQKDRKGSIHFNILKRLLPEGYVSLNGVETNGINEYGQKVSLRSLVEQDFFENITIIGEGGIGKTTFLQNIMNRAYGTGDYNTEVKVPIYIELNRAPAEIGKWYSKRKQKSNFIIRYIAGLLYGFEWLDSSKEALECYEKIERELQKTTVQGKEEYLLLLDGLNEVSMRNADSEGRTIVDYLCMEISVMRKYSNLKIILTSRRVRQAYADSYTHVIELVGVQDEDVEWYLRKSGFTSVQINRILVDQELMDCLRIPLFLCMFGSRKAEGPKTPCSRGEILYNFFHRDSPYYNEHRTAERIQNEQFLKGTQITFIVDFLLPYIGWNMEYIEYFNLEESYLESLIEEFLQNEDHILWSMEAEPFEFYRRRHIRINDIRKELKELPYEKILECITEGLGIIYVNCEGEGAFVHQHFRDYFAAVYEIQTLRMAYALSNIYEKKNNKQVLEKCRELLSEINENIWSETKCLFVGEIAGESRNRPYYKDGVWTKGAVVLEEQRFLSQALKTFRITELLPIEGLYNLIETMKLTRKDLSGANFSRLDLRGCRFNGAICSHRTSEQLLAADFHGSRISDETFCVSGHNGMVLQMQLSFDGENLFTLGEDGLLILWDSRTGKRLHSVQTGIGLGKTGEEAVKIEIMTEYEAVLNRNGQLMRCNVLSGDVTLFEKPAGCRKIVDFNYNPKTDEIAAVYDGNCVITYERERKEGRLAYKGSVLRAWSVENSELMILQEDNHEIKVRKGRRDTQNESYPEIGRFSGVDRILADYSGRTNIFAAKCTEGIFIMDLDSGWWNTYSINGTDINSLKCHQASKARIIITSHKCCLEFDYEEQEIWTVFQDERISFQDMVQCAGDKVFFMDEYEHNYMVNVSTGEVKRMELSDSTMVQKLFVDKQRGHIIVADSKQNLTVYDVLHNQMLMSIQYHRNGEVSSIYCYHEQSNMIAMAAVDYYHVRIFLIDLNTQQEKELYSEITCTEIKDMKFSESGERLIVAMEKQLLSITVANGHVQVIESTEEYRIHSLRILENDQIESCIYYPIGFEKCEKKDVYACRTIYQYDMLEESYIAILSGRLPKLSEKRNSCWAFDGREVAFFKNSRSERGYLNIAVTWNDVLRNIEYEGKPVGCTDYAKFRMHNDYTVPMAVTYDTMLLMQSYHGNIYRLIEYGEKGFFVKNENIILEFMRMENGVCKISRVIKPVIMDGHMVEVVFITWGFENNYYSILANGMVVEMNEMGVIRQEFPVYAGISVVGCDFKGAVVEQELKERLIFHGGKFQ